MKARRNKTPRSVLGFLPFNGVEEEVFTSSILLNLEDICQDFMSYQSKQAYLIVEKAVKLFSHYFYNEAKRIKPDQIVRFTNDCKIRHNDLIKLKTDLALQSEGIEIAVVPFGRDPIEVENLKYFSASDVYVMDFDEEYQNVFTSNCKPRFYAPLFLAALKLFQLYYECGESGLRDQYLLFYNILITAGNVYNEFNTPDKGKEKIAEELIDLLSHTKPEYFDTEVNEAFLDVKKDIVDGRLPYVREINRAIRINLSYIRSSYQDDDYYYSLKSSPSSAPGFNCRQSLLKSSFELDPFRGCQFDEVTGYKSCYNENMVEGYDDPFAKTILIDNPGKVKPRAIHIFTNSIQDRCNYIHNRISKVLQSLPSDCTRDQWNGVMFTRKITSPQYRDEHNLPNLFNADFSNATDTLSQRYQEECLSLLFDKEIVEFWSSVSQMTKRYSSKKVTLEYKQLSGQPQGCLGSFDSFAFAHHIMFLITMKMCNLECYLGSECYRVLGDDSVATGIENDVDILSVYHRVVENFGLVFNIDKAGVVYSGSNMPAILDFAKNTVMNGKFDTPLPSRIASRSANKENGLYYRISSLIWYKVHGVDTTQRLMEVINDHYNVEEDSTANTVANYIVTGGFAPIFKDFSNSNQEPPEYYGKIFVAYLMTKVKATFVEAFLSDKVKETFDLKGYDLQDALESLLKVDGEKYFDIIENPEHKLFKAIDKNLLIEDKLKVITGLDGQWSLLSASLYLTEKEFSAILSLADLIDTLSYDSELTEEVIFEICQNINKELTNLSRFEIRSVSKRIAKNISYFDDTISNVKRLVKDK